ncbi:MAG: hypothetical protein ABFD83_03155 [Armatimonadota bacterium]
MAALNWEDLESNGVAFCADTVARAKVPGGWLVAFHTSGTGIIDDSYGYGGLTFYPDPNHEWDGNSLLSPS